jgi:DNA-binding NarL/FixJ family response regulator
MTHNEQNQGKHLHEITDLSPRIKGAAHNIARQRGDNPDDVEQDIILAILERYTQEPEFLDNTAAYIVQYGAWRASGYVKMSDRIEDHDVYADVGPAVTTANPWEQVSLKLAIEQAMAGLSERDQQIAAALSAGYKPHEIGTDLGISRRTVYYQMRQIAEALSATQAVV